MSPVDSSEVARGGVVACSPGVHRLMMCNKYSGMFIVMYSGGGPRRRCSRG